MNDKAEEWFENLQGEEGLNTIYKTFSSLIISLEKFFDGNEQIETPIMDKEDDKKLSQPTKHTFSVYNIELGSHKNEVEKLLGSPRRVSHNEYNHKWYTYHQHYNKFVSVIYDDNHHVVGLYTNQNLISSSIGVKYGTPKETVQQKLGTPLKKILKGNVYYQIDSQGEYDIYFIDDSYVTIFYDIHNNYTVTAILMIDENLEKQKKDYYGEPRKQLVTGFEYQLFDLTNAARVRHGLKPVKWDEFARATARKHSEDMAKNNFFGHTNLKGQSPFDRMKEDKLVFKMAGENLAYGQMNSIYAHEGLMNSKGHRENILKPEYEYLGVGVAFNNNAQPFFTENFYTK